jgi:hypothetical protein
MSRKPTPPRESLASIDPAALEAVTGGRVSRSSQPDPALLQGMQQLAQAIVAVGQNMAQAKAADSQGMMQMMQQMMQARGGK